MVKRRRRRARAASGPPGAVIALFVGSALTVTVVALATRGAILDALRAGLCDRSGCADAVLAGLGWALFGGPLVAANLTPLLSRTGEPRVADQPRAVDEPHHLSEPRPVAESRAAGLGRAAVLAAAVAGPVLGLALTYTGRAGDPPGPAQTHPELAAMRIGLWLGIAGFLLGMVVARVRVPDRNRDRQARRQHMQVLAAAQLVALPTALIVASLLA